MPASFGQWGLGRIVAGEALGRWWPGIGGNDNYRYIKWQIVANGAFGRNAVIEADGGSWLPSLEAARGQAMGQQQCLLH